MPTEEAETVHSVKRLAAVFYPDRGVDMPTEEAQIVHFVKRLAAMLYADRGVETPMDRVLGFFLRKSLAVLYLAPAANRLSPTDEKLSPA